MEMHIGNGIVSFDLLEINQIIYEKGDDGFLLNSTAYKNGKAYFTDLSLDFSEFYELIGNLDEWRLSSLWEAISNLLINSNSLISEFNPFSVFNAPLVIGNCAETPSNDNLYCPVAAPKMQKLPHGFVATLNEIAA